MSSVGRSRSTSDLVPRSVAAEALAYVGAATALASTGLIVARNPLDVTGRLLAAAAVTIVLLGAGAVVGEAFPSAARMRSVLWFGAGLAWLTFAALLVIDAFELTSRGGALLATALGAAGAVAEWRLCRRSLQQVLAFVTLVAFLLAASIPIPSLLGGFDTSTAGVLLWLFGVAWFVAAASGRFRPRRTGLVLGTITILLAPLFLLRDAGLGGDVLSLLSALALFGTGAALGDRGVQGLAIVALLLEPGVVVSEHLADPEALSVVALAVGLGLLVAGVALVRSAGPDTPAGGAPSGSSSGGTGHAHDVPPPPDPGA